jgi:hypothetical protein
MRDEQRHAAISDGWLADVNRAKRDRRPVLGSRDPRSTWLCSRVTGHVPYHYESSKVLSNVPRDYQPIWRIRS